MDEDNAWARDQSAQFNMWAANTDVFGIGHRSLDSRLKDVPDMQLLMKQLLCSLERDLISEFYSFVTMPCHSGCENYRFKWHKI